MKKYAIVATLFLIFIGLVGCSNTTTNIEKETSNEQPVQEKVKDTKKYDIDKIIVPVSIDVPEDFKAYSDFEIALIKEMAKANNIPVELKEFSINDQLIALERGDIDVIPGCHELGLNELDKFTLTYSYFDGAIVRPNGEEVQPKQSYAMEVRTEDTELLNFFNDRILDFKDSGKLEEIQQQYLGDRN